MFWVGHHVVPGCGGIWTLSEDAALTVPPTYERYQNKLSAVKGEVSTLGREVSTQGKSVSGPGL